MFFKYVSVTQVFKYHLNDCILLVLWFGHAFKFWDNSYLKTFSDKFVPVLTCMSDMCNCLHWQVFKLQVGWIIKGHICIKKCLAVICAKRPKSTTHYCLQSDSTWCNVLSSCPFKKYNQGAAVCRCLHVLHICLKGTMQRRWTTWLNAHCPTFYLWHFSGKSSSYHNTANKYKILQVRPRRRLFCNLLSLPFLWH